MKNSKASRPLRLGAVPRGVRLCLLLPLIMLIGACAHHGHMPEASVAYVESPDPRQQGALYLPQQPGPHAAIIVIHGGGWSGGEPEDMRRAVQRFVEAGYAVYNISYRLAPEHRWPAQIEDVVAASRWLHAHAEDWNIDADRIAVMGYSAGAHLALTLGLRDAQDRPPLQAIVAGAGPTDMSVYTHSPYLERLIGGSGEEFPEEYASASPLRLASADDPPVLLYHGKLDQLVEIEQSRKMAAALAAAGVEHELIELDLGGHITSFLFDGLLWSDIESFLARHLQSASASPEQDLARQN